MENGKIVTVLQPQSVSNSAKETLYVSLRHWKKVAFVIQVGANAGTGANHIAVTVKQASDSAGTGVKAVSFDRHYTQAVTQSVDAPTVVATSSDTFNIVAGTANTMYIVEIQDTQLDIANGFQWVKLSLGASGEAQAILIGVLAVLYDGDYAGLASTLPSAVAPSPV